MLSKIQNPKHLIINFLISLIPITYISGNSLLNLNTLLILLFFFWLYRPNIFKFKLTFLDKLVLIFFLYIFFNAIFNNFFNFPYETEKDKNLILFKALGYLRFLLLFFVVRYLINFNQIKFEYLFLALGLSALFVSLDIIFQFFFRFDFFGLEAPPGERRLAGPFGDEWIAGSFIQRFYIFIIFYILIFTKFKKNWKMNIIFLTILSVTGAGVLMSGNRIPGVMFFLSLLLIILFEKTFRKKFIVLVLIFFVGLYLFAKNNETLKIHYSSFVTKSIGVIDYYKDKFNPSINNEIKIPNSYVKEFETGFAVWDKNKLFGGGIKSFYFNCRKIESKKSYLGYCSPHPHNYYIQFAAELGLIGIFITLILFFSIILRSLKTIFINKNLNDNQLLVPFFIIFLIEIFPLKTTGSFFTTTNATFIFILISFIVGLLEKKKDFYEQ